MVNQRHDITTEDQTYSTGAVSCNDCHSVHVDSSATHGAPVIDPEADTPLPLYDYTNGSYNSGGILDPCSPVGLAAPITCAEPDYIKFCLACHDGAAPTGDVTLPGAMENIAARYALGVNKHGGGDGGGTAKGYLKYPWNAQGATTHPGTPYAALNCTTCHGAHGSVNIFNLRESITVGGVPMRVGGWGDGTDDIGNPRAPYNCTDLTGGPGGGVNPDSCSTTYKLPPIDGRNINEATGVQENRRWGAWCSFCHFMEPHGQSEDATCQSGHVHRQGAF